MNRHLIDLTRGKWRGILIALGIPEHHLTGKHTSCPICGGKDRFRFDDKNGSGSWICNSCGAGYAQHLLEKVRGLDLAAVQTEVERIVGRITPSHAKAPRAKTSPDVPGIWSEAKDAQTADIIGRYLQSRHLDMAAELRAIRFAPRTLYLDEDGNFAGTFPCMLGLIQAPDDKACGLHRTYLASDGGRQASVPYPKKTLGEIADGAAVRLFTRESHLGIAEGIETGLSARHLFDIPVWAALNAGNMEKWTPPDRVTEVTVFGDNDKNFRGQKAAFVLAHRLTLKGYAVHVEIPPRPGTDWNDVLRGDA